MVHVYDGTKTYSSNLEFQCFVLLLAGETVLSPGQPCGSGLTPEAAKDLGLAAGTPIGAGVIDAYAGGLGEF